MMNIELMKKFEEIFDDFFKNKLSINIILEKLSIIGYNPEIDMQLSHYDFNKKYKILPVGVICGLMLIKDSLHPESKIKFNNLVVQSRINKINFKRKIYAEKKNFNKIIVDQQEKIKYLEPRTCGLCGKESNNIIKHHYSYFPEKIIFICASCNIRDNIERNHPLLNHPIEDAKLFYTRHPFLEFIDKAFKNDDMKNHDVTKTLMSIYFNI